MERSGGEFVKGAGGAGGADAYARVRSELVPEPRQSLVIVIARLRFDSHHQVVHTISQDGPGGLDDLDG